MTQHSQNGEGVEVRYLESSRRKVRFDVPTALTNAHVAAFLAGDPVPGAVDQSLAREPATADVGRDTVAFVQEWLMSGDHEPTKWDRDFAAAIDARVIAASAADLAEHFCVTPLPDDVCADLCATVQGPGRYGTHLLTVDQATRVLSAALATTPPTTNDAIPAGMVRWDGGDSAPDDWAGPDSDTLLRNGYRVKGGYRWTHCGPDTPEGTRGTDIIAYTPKASAAPSAPATEAGEEA